MTRKYGSRNIIRPNYLKTFKYEQPINIKDKLEAIKKGVYSLDKE
jgi:hypothetical protein